MEIKAISLKEVLTDREILWDAGTEELIQAANEFLDFTNRDEDMFLTKNELLHKLDCELKWSAAETFEALENGRVDFYSNEIVCYRLELDWEPVEIHEYDRPAAKSAAITAITYWAGYLDEEDESDLDTFYRVLEILGIDVTIIEDDEGEE